MTEMSDQQRKSFWRLFGVFILGAVAMALLVHSVLPPQIVTWQAFSLEIDHSISHTASVEGQIRALEKRDPHKDFGMHAKDQKLFLYAVADGRVIIPNSDGISLPGLFPIHVIAGTGPAKAGTRHDHLNRAALKFAEQFNLEMSGYIMTH